MSRLACHPARTGFPLVPIRPSLLSPAFGPLKARGISRGESHGFKNLSNGPILCGFCESPSSCYLSKCNRSNRYLRLERSGVIALALTWHFSGIRRILDCEMRVSPPLQRKPAKRDSCLRAFG